MKESVLTFNCAGEPLVGILAEPSEGKPAEVGVVIIVGGPQYRAGSHRQFTLLARDLAAQGFAALRFDYRGMGDSGGAARDFTGVQADIAAAIAALLAARPGVRRVMLWGLCDAASAALIYLADRPDPRVAGLTLLNPWVRNASSMARAQVKHYYVRRLLEPAFWRKLLGGGVALTAGREFLGKLMASRKLEAAPDFVGVMASSWLQQHLPLTLILSGDDLVAREFADRVANDPRWHGALQRSGVECHTLEEADHTFSALPQKQRAAAISLQAVQRLAGHHPSSETEHHAGQR